jgi:hypothetical protein
MEDDYNGPSAEDLAAIPKALLEMTLVRRGKRRACDTNTDMGSKLEKLKSTNELMYFITWCIGSNFGHNYKVLRMRAQ